MDTLTLPWEIKSLDDAGHIEGLAAGFGNVDHGGDKIMPGAFTKSLAAAGNVSVPMLLHHDHKRPVGAWNELQETPEGLAAKGRIILDSRDGADAHALVKGGAMRGLSVGYQTMRKSYQGDVRQLHELRVHEISLVPIPMNERTMVRAVKSIASIGDLRDLLHDAGFSTRESKAMAGAAWKARSPEDDEAQDRVIANLFSTFADRLAKL